MTTMQRDELELMLPAGSWESLASALQTKADAVYFGTGVLNMRSVSSANFTLDDLAVITARCHECGVKAYLTLNTIIYDDDFAAMHDTLAATRQAGVDAIIA